LLGIQITSSNQLLNKTAKQLLLEHIHKTGLAIRLTPEQLQDYCSLMMQRLGTATTEAELSARSKEFEEFAKSNAAWLQQLKRLPSTAEKNEFSRWYLKMLHQHSLHNTLLLDSLTSVLENGTPEFCSKLAGYLQPERFTSAQLRTLLDCAQNLAPQSYPAYFTMVQALFNQAPNELSKIDVNTLVVKITTTPVAITPQGLQYLHNFIEKLPKTLGATQINHLCHLFLDYCSVATEANLLLLANNFPQDYASISIRLRNGLLQRINCGVNDNQQKLFFEIANAFYASAQRHGNNIQSIFAELEQHFEFGSPHKQQARVAFMHLLFQQVLVLREDNADETDHRWDNDRNQALLKFCFAKYTAHAKVILASKGKTSGRHQYDLNLHQHQQLMNLAYELKLITSEQLPAKFNPLTMVQQFLPNNIAGIFMAAHRNVQPTATNANEATLNHKMSAAVSLDNKNLLAENLQRALKSYSGTWFKSASRQEQLKTLKEQINTQLRSPTPRYDGILAVLRKAKDQAMTQDIQVNKSWFRRWFKGHNSEGNSRYYNTLNQMYDAVLGSWSQDLAACNSFGNYRDYLEKDMRMVANKIGDAFAAIVDVTSIYDIYCLALDEATPLDLAHLQNLYETNKMPLLIKQGDKYYIYGHSNGIQLKLTALNSVGEMVDEIVFPGILAKNTKYKKLYNHIAAKAGHALTPTMTSAVLNPGLTNPSQILENNYQNMNVYGVYRFSKFLNLTKIAQFGWAELNAQGIKIASGWLGHIEYGSVLHFFGLSNTFSAQPTATPLENTGLLNFPKLQQWFMKKLYASKSLSNLITLFNNPAKISLLLKEGPDRLLVDQALGDLLKTIDELPQVSKFDHFLTESGIAFCKMLPCLILLTQKEIMGMPLEGLATLLLNSPQFLDFLDKNIPLLAQDLPGHMVTLLKELRNSGKLLNTHLKEHIHLETNVMDPGILFKYGA
jgi:hypothetical protein